MNYECECIENMELVDLSNFFSIKTNNFSNLAVPDNGRLNIQNNEGEW